jgi:hypothetical protein
VTEGLLLWLDADQVDGEPDTAVQTWPDLSGNDLDAVALSGTAAPTLVMGAIGSRPALHFDGIDDYLQLPSGFDDFSSGLSLFVVVDATVLTGGFKFFALGNGELVDNVGFGRDGTNPSLQFFVDHSSLGTHYFTSDGVLVQNEPAIYAVLQGPGSPDSDITANILKNGLSVGSGASYVPPLEERGTNYLGRSQFASDSLFQGDMAEVILFDRQLSAAERIDVHEHLQGKYDL